MYTKIDPPLPGFVLFLIAFIFFPWKVNHYIDPVLSLLSVVLTIESPINTLAPPHPLYHYLRVALASDPFRRILPCSRVMWQFPSFPSPSLLSRSLPPPSPPSPSPPSPPLSSPSLLSQSLPSASVPSPSLQSPPFSSPSLLS